jgi:hypothetical protein
MNGALFSIPLPDRVSSVLGGAGVAALAGVVVAGAEELLAAELLELLFDELLLSAELELWFEAA